MLHQTQNEHDDDLQLTDETLSAGDPPPQRQPGTGRASRAAAAREKAKTPDRPRVTRTSSGSKSGKNPYRTRSAAQIRAEREARQRTRSITSLTDQPRPTPRKNVLDSATVNDLLRHPTRIVTEDELRRDYTYVIKDLRSMGVLSAGLVIVLIILATVLPQ
jgi:hypothetical protein